MINLCFIFSENNNGSITERDKDVFENFEVENVNEIDYTDKSTIVKKRVIKNDYENEAFEY